MQFYEILTELLEDHDIQKKDLANHLKLSPSAVTNYVNAHREPDFETLIKIADYFSVSTDYLIGHQTNQHLSHDEEHLVHLFRQMTEENQKLFLNTAIVFAQNDKQN